MDHLKATICLCFILFGACGEQQSPEDLAGGDLAQQSNNSWIVGTWKGTQTVQRAGQAASSASVKIKFFANQAYQLSFPDQASNFVKGEFVVNSNRTILLRVEQSSAKLYEENPLPESFRYSYQKPQLQIFNQEVQLNLQLSDDTEKEGESASTSEELFSLFDTWTCHGEQKEYLWKVNIIDIDQKSYYLKRYTSNNRIPEERAGKLASYEETPPREVELKKAHIIFEMDKRRLNLVFAIEEEARILKVEYYQGSFRPNSPEELNCFRY
ncbi:MAG: hypothetical protein HRU09_02985 [Oligoflexales bacterium]|nr:hypothetical protein [Oligoflexales bacterium]